MVQLFKNNVSGVLALQLSAIATSMTLVDASGFPDPGADFYAVTLIGINNNGQEASWEVVKVIAKAANTLTIVRAQESTVAAVWPSATTVQLRLTAGFATALVSHVDNKSNPHSVTKTQVGLGSVDNTSDAAKPVSTAQQTALNLKANLAGPALTGVPTAPTAAVNTNTPQLATTAFVNAEIANDAAPIAHVGSGGTAHANVIAAGAAGFMSGADKTKLDGVATGATANATDAQLRDRATHTGAQATSTITGLDAALAGKQALDADLTAIAALVGTTGLLRKTAADTWTLDTAAYSTTVGTVTGVTGTAPVVSSGGAAPVISMAAATASVNGYMTSTYAAKLDGIAVSANNYAHPANHPPSIITQDASNRFVTDAEKTTWNAKAPTASPTFTGYARAVGGAASTGIAAMASATTSFEAQAQGTAGTAGAAVMTFHRPSVHAAFFGLDTDNKWKVGGWSMGAVAYSIYHEGNKPTKADVGLSAVDNTSDANKPVSTATQTALNLKLNLTGGTVTGEIVSTVMDSFRMKYGDYGVFWRNDGNSFYLLQTASGDQNGSFNAARPFSFNLITGLATLNGNASTATTLATARSINGTSFNGGANITTANWGTARTLTVGSTGKSVNGSANVSWSLAEIGAQAALVSGTNIKTINGTSLLGGGNMVVAGGGDLIRSARTSNTILGTADKGKLIDITSGTFTQTFDAAASLGSGWYCYLRNSGTGDITLDPNATEMIDGLASYVMYPGEVRLVQCDGTALRSVVLHSFYRVFAASGTFIKPPGYARFEGMLWGGGGSGGKGGPPATGGAGGAAAPFYFSDADLSASTTVTIGAGGSGASVAGDTSGVAGGQTTFSSITAFGGAGGRGGSDSALGGNAFANISSSYLFSGRSSVTDPAIYGGGSSSFSVGYTGITNMFGAAAGGTINSSNVALAIGTSVFGGQGGASSLAASASSGTVPGGGGGGTVSGALSGAGARGELRIWGVI